MTEQKGNISQNVPQEIVSPEASLGNLAPEGETRDPLAELKERYQDIGSELVDFSASSKVDNRLEIYQGSFLTEKGLAQKEMDKLAELIGHETGALFVWRRFVKNKPLSAGANSNSQAVAMVFSDAVEDDGENHVLVSINPLPKYIFDALPGHEIVFDPGEIYVGDAKKVAQFFGLSCQALEEGVAPAKIVSVARSIYPSTNHSATEDPQAAQDYLKRYQEQLLGEK